MDAEHSEHTHICTPDLPEDSPEDLQLDEPQEPQKTAEFNLETAHKWPLNIRKRKFVELGYDPHNPQEEDPWSTHCQPAGNGRHKCGLCDIVVKSRRALSLHLRIHRGVKPEQCRFCDKSFAHPANLRAHEQSSLPGHLGQKKCVCERCGKAFAHSDSRTAHMRKQHGVVKLDKYGRDPYRCGVCYLKFSNKQNRNRHMRNKHRAHYEKYHKKKKSKVWKLRTSMVIPI